MGNLKMGVATPEDLVKGFPEKTTIDPFDLEELAEWLENKCCETFGDEEYERLMRETKITECWRV